MGCSEAAEGLCVASRRVTIARKGANIERCEWSVAQSAMRQAREQRGRASTIYRPLRHTTQITVQTHWTALNRFKVVIRFGVEMQNVDLRARQTAPSQRRRTTGSRESSNHGTTDVSAHLGEGILQRHGCAVGTALDDLARKSSRRTRVPIMDRKSGRSALISRTHAQRPGSIAKNAPEPFQW